MSRSWFGEVVFGYPIESEVSEKFCGCQTTWSAVKRGGTHLVDDVEMISEGCRRHRSESILQELDGHLDERECEERIDYL